MTDVSVASPTHLPKQVSWPVSPDQSIGEREAAAEKPPCSDESKLSPLDREAKSEGWGADMCRGTMKMHARSRGRHPSKRQATTASARQGLDGHGG
jgi:hypothetical protein